MPINLVELSKVSKYDFPSLGDILYRTVDLKDMNSLPEELITSENLVFCGKLDETELPSLLEAYERAPKANAENSDLWVLFKCYLFIAWRDEIENVWPVADMLNSYKELFCLDRKEIRKLPERDQNNATGRLRTYERFTDIQEKETWPEDQLQESIVNEILSEFISRNLAESTFRIEGLKLKPCTICKDKHAAMIYQLLLYITRPDIAKGRYFVIKCGECKEQFISTARQTRYCKNCGTVFARQRRSRANRLTKEGK